VDGRGNTGLFWFKIGPNPPRIGTGTEIVNGALAEALQLKVQFSHEELSEFKLGKLPYGLVYIKVGDTYLQSLDGKKTGAPAAESEGNTGMLRRLLSKLPELSRTQRVRTKTHETPRISRTCTQPTN
jgi:hypothetical protein